MADREIKVKAGSFAEITVEEGRLVYIRKVYFEEGNNTATANEWVQLHLTVDKKKFVIANLNPNNKKLRTEDIMLVLDKSFQLSHTMAQGSVWFYLFQVTQLGRKFKKLDCTLSVVRRNIVTMSEDSDVDEDIGVHDSYEARYSPYTRRCMEEEARLDESESKTPRHRKKAKTTPHKTEGKATSHPSKRAAKTPAGGNNLRPASASSSSDGARFCKACNKKLKHTSKRLMVTRD